jgi:hypothetical protein
MSRASVAFVEATSRRIMVTSPDEHPSMTRSAMVVESGQRTYSRAGVRDSSSVGKIHLRSPAQGVRAVRRPIVAAIAALLALTGAAAIGGARADSASGTVVAWGNNHSSILAVPAGLSGVTAIAAGDYIGVALTSDGTVVGWGPPYELPPAGLSGVTAISAGEDYGLALKSDGTVVGWGPDTRVTTPPAGLSGVVAISAGKWDAFALKGGGTVVGWGSYDPCGMEPSAV